MRRGNRWGVPKEQSAVLGADGHHFVRLVGALADDAARDHLLIREASFASRACKELCAVFPGEGSIFVDVDHAERLVSDLKKLPYIQRCAAFTAHKGNGLLREVFDGHHALEIL